MAVATYTARRRIAPGHFYGKQYSVVFDMQELTPLVKARQEEARSLSGNTEAVLHGVDQGWQITTDIQATTPVVGVAASDADRFREFLNSVLGEYTFILDLDATALDANGDPIAVRPMVCEMADDDFHDKSSKKRGFREFGFKCREVGDPTYAQNYYHHFDLTQLHGIKITALNSSDTGVNYDILPNWIYTRSGTMYAMQSDGVFHAYADNVFANHYDMIGGRNRGIWLGTSQTNKVTYSSDFSVVSWALTGSTARAPAAGKLFEAGTAGVNPQTLTPASASGGVALALGTFTGNNEVLYAIAETGGKIGLSLYNSTAGAHACLAELDCTTGAVTNPQGAGTVRAVKLLNTGPNGAPVWLLALNASATAGNNRFIYFYADRVTGTTPATLHHVQLVEGGANLTTISPPIVTNGAAVTRGVDVFYTSAIPSWLTLNKITLAVLCEFDDLQPTSSTSRVLVGWGGGNLVANTDRGHIVLPNAATLFQQISYTGAVSQVGINKGTPAVGRFKLAARFVKDNFAFSVNGAAVGTDTNGTMPAAMTDLHIGSAYNNTGQPNCYLLQAVFAGADWDNATLQSFTT